MSKYNVMDLFSGVGGLSYGFSKLSDFNILAANEIERDISIAYSKNHPNVTMLNCDINDLTEEKLKEVLKDKRIDLIVGGPPCQSYSTLGKRQMDERANLFMQYKRILTILSPKAFVFENVSGILSMDHGTLFKRIKAEFESIGYTLKYKLLDAVNYGVPQHRERVILVGFKGINKFEYPAPTHGEGLKPYVTLENAIGDLPCIKSGETNNSYATDANNDFYDPSFSQAQGRGQTRNAPHHTLVSRRAPESQIPKARAHRRQRRPPPGEGADQAHGQRQRPVGQAGGAEQKSAQKAGTDLRAQPAPGVQRQFPQTQPAGANIGFDGCHHSYHYPFKFDSKILSRPGRYFCRKAVGVKLSCINAHVGV